MTAHIPENTCASSIKIDEKYSWNIKRRNFAELGKNTGEFV